MTLKKVTAGRKPAHAFPSVRADANRRTGFQPRQTFGQLSLLRLAASFEVLATCGSSGDEVDTCFFSGSGAESRFTWAHRRAWAPTLDDAHALFHWQGFGAGRTASQAALAAEGHGMAIFRLIGGARHGAVDDAWRYRSTAARGDQILTDQYPSLRETDSLMPA